MYNHDDALRESNKRYVEHSLATAFEPEWWENLDDDVIFEFPYGPSLGMPDRFVGREACTAYLKTMLAQIGDLKFRDIDVIGTDDPNLFVAEYKANIPTPAGTTYEQQYISKVRVKDGKTYRYREFWDPARVTRAVGEYSAEAA